MATNVDEVKKLLKLVGQFLDESKSAYTDIAPQVNDTLEKGVTREGGAPSPESEAALCLGEIEKHLVDLITAFKGCHKELGTRCRFSTWEN